MAPPFLIHACHVFTGQAFPKRGAEQFTMPPWMLTELEAALPLFPKVTKQRLHELHRKWGGSIRYCLGTAFHTTLSTSERWRRGS